MFVYITWPWRHFQPYTWCITAETSRSHSDTPHSVGLLWTSDQPDAETYTWQHKTITRDRQPCPRRDSNPQSQRSQTDASDHAATWISCNSTAKMNRLILFREKYLLIAKMAQKRGMHFVVKIHHHHHHHHHQHQVSDPLIRSVSTVTAARDNVSSVFQLFSFLVVCSGVVISEGFSFVAFFASVKASSVCIHLSCLLLL